MTDFPSVSATFKSISEKDFKRLGELIYSQCGIQMKESKRTMLQARLQKRMRKLGVDSFEHYCNYLFSPDGMKDELIHLIDVVTTNKTDFFREPKHFEYLTKKAIPELINVQKSVRKSVSIWSAGCSTGQEPYTLAMVLNDFAEKLQGFTYSILATDISTQVLEKAKLAIYESEVVEPVPLEFKRKYLLRSKDKNKDIVRVASELRDRICFRRLNFMDDDFGLREPVDIIFCRNVIIYFDRPTQEKLFNRFCRYLSIGGYIFVGHSETLHSLNVPLTMVAPTIYRRNK